MECLRDTDAGVILEVVLAPRSSRLNIVGLYDGRLKIALTAPPVDGKANDQLVRFLSKTFGIARSDVQITAGLKSKKKSILLRGVGRGGVARTLDELPVRD